MPHIKIKLEWYDETPKGAPIEETTVWPRAIETEEEASNFRAAIHEYMDDQYGEQPRTISWDGPFGAPQEDR
ncbi:hypothetical protein [Sphingomonas sp. BAUL-RG-20F-R05-02]|uniref:hypothetical protein n=1 Tax=Sphingomonas sp. BAUL-RG-20F-R05-02 TaxID=2914830 RepID=UPI001F595F7A|nr:hypothetical protein [Sphingomonas sp. BAUL-RG-20F-R05-02]